MNTKELGKHRAPPVARQLLPKIGTAQLMKGMREIIIQHGSEEYRLRITATGKLILTK